MFRAQSIYRAVYGYNYYMLPDVLQSKDICLFNLMGVRMCTVTLCEFKETRQPLLRLLVLHFGTHR